METEPQREPLAEIPLLGGQLTPGIVRVGNIVRRPPKGNVAFVHDLLLFLDANFDMKLLEFHQLSWQGHFSSSGFSS